MNQEPVKLALNKSMANGAPQRSREQHTFEAKRTGTFLWVL
jgi:hypothetical protein